MPKFVVENAKKWRSFQCLISRSLNIKIVQQNAKIYGVMNVQFQKSNLCWKHLKRQQKCLIVEQIAQYLLPKSGVLNAKAVFQSEFNLPPYSLPKARISSWRTGVPSGIPHQSRSRFARQGGSLNPNRTTGRFLSTETPPQKHRL